MQIKSYKSILVTIILNSSLILHNIYKYENNPNHNKIYKTFRTIHCQFVNTYR